MRDSMSIDKDGLRPTSGFTLDLTKIDLATTYDAFRSYEATKTYAFAQGWSVVLPKSNELFLDYDTDDEKKAGLKLLRLFSKYYQNSTLSEKYQVRSSGTDLKMTHLRFWRFSGGAVSLELDGTRKPSCPSI
jgi:hypothetical protein